MTQRGASAAAVAVFLGCAAAVFWITGGVAPWEADRGNLWHHYEYLADGFLNGHSYLSVDPAPELTRLADPYDPAANEAYRLWDASLYHGKYYMYYGPVPALVLMAPWRALTGHVLPQRIAVAVFACVGMAFLTRFLSEVRRRQFPGLSAGAFAFILVVAFHASWLPVTLRRPGVWELPIVAAVACLWAALYFLWKFHDSGRRTAWGAATGVALALLMGCRATAVLGAGTGALLLLAPQGTPGARSIPWRGALLGSALAGAGGIALLLYNHARFGQWLEFGQSYQLWGMKERLARHFDPSFIGFNFSLYVASVPTLSPYFPFIRGCWPASLPSGYIATEEMQGALFVMPVHVAGFWALARAWGSRQQAGARPLSIALAAAACATVCAAAVLFCFAGACSRYSTELFAGWSVVTAVGLMALLGDGGAGGSRFLRVLAVAAGCWTIAGAWLASAEFRGFMRQTEPRTYAAAARILDTPSLWSMRSEGVVFGPLDLDIRVPGAAPAGTVLVASGRPEMVNQLILDPVDESHVRLSLAENQHVILRTGPLTVTLGRLRVRLAAPWLYPPREHPYWDGVADAGRRADLQTRFSIEAGQAAFTAHSTRSFDAASFRPTVLGASEAAPDSPYIEASTPAGQP
jgi:hypothetical protein